MTCENNLQEIMAYESLKSVKFDLWPLLQGPAGNKDFGSGLV